MKSTDCTADPTPVLILLPSLFALKTKGSLHGLLRVVLLRAAGRTVVIVAVVIVVVQDMYGVFGYVLRDQRRIASAASQNMREVALCGCDNCNGSTSMKKSGASSSFLKDRGPVALNSWIR